jgi:radical SAM superfamily enzyme YgiQ (UPF0313 family)
MASIQLVKSPSQGEMVIADKWYLPLELLWIGAYVRKFGHEVEILDGQLLTTEEIKKRLCAPIVGIGINIHSSAPLEELVKAAKSKGALVVVGGQAATQISSQLLRANEGIDAVVCYDGEEAVRQIADALDAGRDPFVNTPNVVYRRGEEIVTNRVEEVPVCSVPIPDRRLNGINMEQYIANFKATNTFLGFDGERGTNAHTKKGCPRRCSFCGRTDKLLRARTPQQAFEEYRYLTEEFGVDYIFDHSDTWALGKSWLEEFRAIHEREGGLKARLSVFADLRDLSPRIIENLKAVGIDTVETGIESGNEGILKENRKFMHNEDIISRVAALTKAGIKVEASYVLGIIGETRQSVRETLDLSRILREKAGQVRNYFNIIFPLPGTLIWNLLMRDPDMRDKYGDGYDFDIEQLRRDYLARHCDLGQDAYEFLFEERSNILAENGLRVMEYAR